MCRVVIGQDDANHDLHLTGTEHRVVIVTLADGTRWLTDVGFGGQVPRHPLRLDQLDLDPPPDPQTYGTRQHESTCQTLTHLESAKYRTTATATATLSQQEHSQLDLHVLVGSHTYGLLQCQAK